MADYLTPGMSLFVGGFVAALFVFAGGLAAVAGDGSSLVGSFALTLVALGGVFFLAGVVGGVLLRVLDRE
jgi:hypothetical protein